MKIFLSRYVGRSSAIIYPMTMSYQVRPRGVDDVILGGQKETVLDVDGYGSSGLQFSTIQ